jgi:tetratricopeptide (TPR) repeat protein
MVAVSAPEPLTAEEFSASTPDWLRSTDEQHATILDWQTQTPEPAEEVITYIPPAAPPPPVAPPPTPAASGTLEEARARYQEGDVDGSLTIYEVLVRAGQSLADVANDLTSIAGSSKNPVAYRVLGDSLMRQGRLQDALNTYRQALNLL